MTKIQKYTAAEFIEKSLLFFTKLGYKNLKSEPTPALNDINISGTATRFGQEFKLSVKCLVNDDVDRTSISSYLRDEEEKNIKGKIFIVTPALFDEENLIPHRKNVMLLPGNVLSKYYSILKIA
jgi:hypothetical protein